MWIVKCVFLILCSPQDSGARAELLFLIWSRLPTGLVVVSIKIELKGSEILEENKGIDSVSVMFEMRVSSRGSSHELSDKRSLKVWKHTCAPPILNHEIL